MNKPLKSLADPLLGFAKQQVASDSGLSTVGIEKGTNQPGEKGDLGPKVDSIPASSKDTRGV